MMITIMFTINFMLNTLFLTMTHPLASTLIIIMQTIIVCLMLGTLMYSYWFSYIMFLIFLGGMLVLFIYITSLASNEMFSMMTNKNITTFSFTSIILIIIITMNNFMFNMNNKTDILNYNMKIMLNTESPKNLIQLYNLPTANLTILTILYLLLTLIIIIKITQIHEGPLRQSS